MKYERFEDLEVWQTATQLAVGVFLLHVTFGWHGLHNILHGNTCWTRFFCGPHQTARTTMGTERRELLPKLAQVKEGDNANFRIRD